MYQSELTEILEKHAPLKSRLVTIRPAGPWYNDEIKHEKRARRRYERRWRTTKLPSDRLKFTEQCRKVNHLLHSCRSEYYSKLICDNRFDQRRLFGILSKILHRSQEPLRLPHASVKELADNFINFFRDKIVAICQDTEKIAVQDDIILPELCSPSTVLEKFASISYDKLRASSHLLGGLQIL